MGTLLSIIARVVFFIFLPVAKVFTWLKYLALLDYKSYDKHMYNEGLAVDQLGNVVYMDLFTFVFVTKHSTFAFGNADHTISYVIAKNYYAGTTTIFGHLMGRFLDWLDTNHMIKAIINNEGEEAVDIIIQKFNIKLSK